MRNVLGGLILVIGGLGLGWFAKASAERIEAEITAQAQTVACQALHSVEVTVSGRDISATGLVDSLGELDRLSASFDTIVGRRAVDLSALTLLPVADPFEMRATRAGDGAIQVSGAIPSRTALNDLPDEVQTDTLIVSSGVPDEAWTAAALVGLRGLEGLISGDTVLSNRTLTVQGRAATPVARDRVLRSLDDLPEGYMADARIDVVDDGTPFRINLSTRGGAVVGTGKLPAQMTAGDISALFDGADVSLEPSVLEADHRDWPETVRIGIGALKALTEGDLIISEASVTLAGEADIDGLARAEALLEQIPARFDVTTDIALLNDAQPFEVRIYFDGIGAEIEGQVPADFDLPLRDDVDVLNLSDVAVSPDPDGRFSQNVIVAFDALGLLQNGEVTITADRIDITGNAATPSDLDRIDAALTATAGNTTVFTDVSVLDDGTPPAWRLDYTAAGGGVLQGKLPADLTPATLAATLGLQGLGGQVDQGLGRLDDSSIETLAMAGDYLPEADALSFETSPDGPVLDVVLAPGVNVDLVAVDLAQRLPLDVAFSIRGQDTIPLTGATRVNQATQSRQRFVYGNWLPIQTFAPVLSICVARSNAVLDQSGIGFLLASSQLDGKSIRAINDLSAIVQRCVGDGGLRLEIAGHTDATVSEADNQALSEARAAAVRTALVERGVDGDAILIRGYGQTRPIGDNATEDGRASNRRTEFIWSE